MTGQASRRLAAGLVGSLLFAATSCGSDAAPASVATVPASTQAAVTTTLAAPTTVATTDAPLATDAPKTAVATTTISPAPEAGGMVNINEASTSELEAAFDAAGVTNARRWAREVDEYRPYPTDPDFAKLRQELGKYNIDPAVLELIIATLEY